MTRHRLLIASIASTTASATAASVVLATPGVPVPMDADIRYLFAALACLLGLFCAKITHTLIRSA